MTTLLIGLGSLTAIACFETSLKRKGKRLEAKTINTIINLSMGATIALLLFKFTISLGQMFL